jgi:hypothetical protein
MSNPTLPQKLETNRSFCKGNGNPKKDKAPAEQH